MKIAVYCSSSDNLPAAWQEGAKAVGNWIGKHKFQLVYGGIDLGLMRIAAEACKAAGGTVVGVVPTRRANQASPLNDVSVPTAGLNDRKDVMQLLCDTFVVLPGGYGTLDEFASSFAYVNFNKRLDKRVILYNPDGIFDSLVNLFNDMIARGVMTPDRLDILTVATNLDELIDALEQRRRIVKKEEKV